MNVRARVGASLLLFLLFAGPLFAQRAGFLGSRLLVGPFENRTQNQDLDAITTSLRDTLFQTLALTRRFDVRLSVVPGYLEGELDRDAIAAAVRATRADGFVTGFARATPRGGVELTVELYGTAAGTIIGRESRSSFGAFDVIPTADELLVAVAGALTGVPINFGALVLRTNQTGARLRLYVDDVLIGENLPIVPQLLEGQRRVSIFAVTADGEQLVYTTETVIRGGEAAEISFATPRTTGTDLDYVISRLDFIRAGINGAANPQLIQRAFEEASLVERSQMAGMAALREEYRLLQESWRVQREFESLSVAWYHPDAIQDGARRWAATEAIAGEPARFGLRFGPPTAAIATADGGDRARIELAGRVERNLLAHGYLTQLGYFYALTRNDFGAAQRALEELARITADYQMPFGSFLRQEQPAFDAQSATYRTNQRRFRQPWAYLLTMAGAGAMGYSGHLYSTNVIRDKVAAADVLYRRYQATGPDPTEVRTARRAAEDAYREAEIQEWFQLGLAAGGALAILAGYIWGGTLARNAAYDMGAWARERHPVATAVAVRLFGTDAVTAPGAAVLVLGPLNAVLGSGVLDTVPTIRTVTANSSLDVGRPPVAVTDIGRTYGAGLSVVVVR